jgi:hypothetical protein
MRSATKSTRNERRKRLRMRSDVEMADAEVHSCTRWPLMSSLHFLTLIVETALRFKGAFCPLKGLPGPQVRVVLE